jgi:hypothetical protein
MGNLWFDSERTGMIMTKVPVDSLIDRTIYMEALSTSIV